MSNGPGSADVTSELFARVGATEVELGRQGTDIRNLSSQIQNLTDSVGELRTSVQKIESALGGVGKLSGTQILTQIGSVIAAVTFLGSVYVSPLSTKLDGIEKTITFQYATLDGENDRIERLVKEHDHPQTEAALERLDERVKNQVDALRSEILATKDLLRAEMGRAH